MSRLRAALVALLVASTALFAIGVVAERSQSEEQPAAAHARDLGESGSGPESAHSEENESAGEAETSSAHGEQRERLLGIDTESTPLIVLAVVAGLALAALAASTLGRRPGVLLTIAAIAIIWAALDVHEAVHQIDESRTGLALLALGVAVLHFAAAAAAGRLAGRERAEIGSPGRPGTMTA